MLVESIIGTVAFSVGALVTYVVSRYTGDSSPTNKTDNQIGNSINTNIKLEEESTKDYTVHFENIVIILLLLLIIRLIELGYFLFKRMYFNLKKKAHENLTRTVNNSNNINNNNQNP